MYFYEGPETGSTSVVKTVPRLKAKKLKDNDNVPSYEYALAA